MPFVAPRTETSTTALDIGARPARAGLAGEAMGRAGSPEALAQLTAAMAELKALEVQPLLRRAVTAIETEDWKDADNWVQKALQRDECCGFAWYLMGIVRERMGDFANSLRSYEAALALIPEHSEVANDLGRLAYRLDMKPQAEKLFRHFLARHPDNLEGVNNLACAIRDQMRFEEATELLRPAIMGAPTAPHLWNTMGTISAEQGDFSNAEIFFREALRLDDAFYKSRYNLGNALLALGDPAGALVACEGALTQVTSVGEEMMMRLARSTIFMTLGRIGEGWDEYEARLNPEFADTTHFMFDRPRWTPGAELAGKSLLVVAEQGLGDEILFSNLLPDVIERMGPQGHLTLVVEPRLVPLFQRTYPAARVAAHATYDVAGRSIRLAPTLGDNIGDIDLWTPMGSLLREFRRTVEAFPDRPSFLTPDPERVAHWRKVLESAPAGPKVGLLWKSASDKGARHRFFSPFGQWEDVLRTPGVTFVNLQYGDCSEELAQAERDFGVRIWNPPGIDLKQDIDDVAALCGAMDLVIGFANATLNIAGASGIPTWLIVSPAAWPVLGQDRYLWYPQSRMFTAKTFGDWAPVMTSVAAALGDHLKSR